MDEFKEIQIQGEKPRTVWVAIISVGRSPLEGQRKIAIVMNARHFEDAEDIDYLITNLEGEIVTEQWIVDAYGQRNWVEVFYREAIMMVRNENSKNNHRQAIACPVKNYISRYKQNHCKNNCPHNRTEYIFFRSSTN